MGVHIDDDFEVYTRGGRFITKALELMNTEQAMVSASFDICPPRKRWWNMSSPSQYKEHSGILTFTGPNLGTLHMSLQATVINVPLFITAFPLLNAENNSMWTRFTEDLIDIAFAAKGVISVFLNSSWGCKKPVGLQAE